MRRQRIGSALVTQCIDAGHRLGIEKIHLDALAENTLAIEYWINSG